MKNWAKNIMFGEVKRCSDESPAKDGTYIVLGVNSITGEIYSMRGIHYTTKFGWNTHVSDKWRLPLETSEENYWCECYTDGGDQK